MQKIHMECVNEYITQNKKRIPVPWHYFYLCSGGSCIYLCKQRPDKYVKAFFLKDIPVKALHSYKWRQGKALDRIVELLRRRIAYCQRWEAEYAA